MERLEYICACCGDPIMLSVYDSRGHAKRFHPTCHTNLKEMPMLLFLKYVIKATGDNELLFFETAYYWRFQKRQEVFNDVVQYRLNAVVPKYVEEYVKHLQQKGGWDVPQEKAQ